MPILNVANNFDSINPIIVILIRGYNTGINRKLATLHALDIPYQKLLNPKELSILPTKFKKSNRVKFFASKKSKWSE